MATTNCALLCRVMRNGGQFRVQRVCVHVLSFGEEPRLTLTAALQRAHPEETCRRGGGCRRRDERRWQRGCGNGSGRRLRLRPVPVPAPSVATAGPAASLVCPRMPYHANLLMPITKLTRQQEGPHGYACTSFDRQCQTSDCTKCKCQTQECRCTCFSPDCTCQSVAHLSCLSANWDPVPLSRVA